MLHEYSFSDVPNCFFRRHPAPTKEMLEPLLRTAAAVGVNLNVSSSKALADSLDHAVVRTLNLYMFITLVYLVGSFSFLEIGYSFWL